MSQSERLTSVTAESSKIDAPMVPNGKSTVAAPKMSDDEHVELKDMLPTGPEPDEDIMQLARVGDIQGIEKLYESGKFTATYCDEEGITPLHVFALVSTIWKWDSDQCYSGPPLTTNMPCASSF